MAYTHNGVSVKNISHNGEKVKKWIHNGVQIYASEVIVWTDLAFEKTHVASGAYYIEEQTTQDLTDHDYVDISVVVTFTGSYRGSNDFVSLFIDDTEYVLLASGNQSEAYNLAKTIDISELSGEHTIKLWVRGNSASSTYWGSFSGTASLRLYS